jgi:hypothetical protein
MSDTQAMLDSGDIAGLIRYLQVNADSMELAEVAKLMEGVAAISGFDDIREAAAALARAQGPQQLHDFGYACLERGVAVLAILAFRRALEIMPGEPTLLINLVNSLQEENRHAEALAALEPHVGSMDPWPARYLLAYSALFAGEITRAEREAGRLPTPDSDWLPARDRLARMIARARAARAVSPLDDRDLRGWHFALSGGLLITISPFGFEGMNGRYGFISDTFASCRSSLDHLQQILAATGRQPASVGLLPDRSSRILGLAAAQLLELPAEPFVRGRADVLVIAYDLNEAKPPGLWERADGQVLFEHASCWTARRVSADVIGFLHQVVTSPWAERLKLSPNREVETIPPDERPTEELAAEIVRAASQSVDGEADAPQDSDAALLRLAKAVGSQWLKGPRDPVFSLGPVASNRFH